ncbi:MAG: NAD(P)-dependent oxidoreductase [Saprospiraceae bacterium]|nr:NAD(P)-dependent oxidoreductase [Saprospiraceae bacterium]
MSKKLLITGASGFLGWHLCRHAPDGWNIVGTYHGNASGLFPKTPALQLDLQDKDAMWQAMKSQKPDAVLHLAAASNPAHCEANKAESRELNVEATMNLAEFCAELRSKLVFTSSSQVYDGLQALNEEAPTPSPQNEYGKQKLEAEQRVQEILPEAAILRVAVMFGMAGPGTNNFLQQWLSAWQQGKEVTAFYDEIRSFLSGRSAAAGVFKVLEKGAEGVFNLGGASAISRHAFAELASTVFELPAAKIIRKSQQEVQLTSFRPANLTMSLEKIKGLGFQPAEPWEELAWLRKYTSYGS